MKQHRPTVGLRPRAHFIESFFVLPVLTDRLWPSFRSGISFWICCLGEFWVCVFDFLCVRAQSHSDLPIRIVACAEGSRIGISSDSTHSSDLKHGGPVCLQYVARSVRGSFCGRRSYASMWPPTWRNFSAWNRGAVSGYDFFCRLLFSGMAPGLFVRSGICDAHRRVDRLGLGRFRIFSEMAGRYQTAARRSRKTWSHKVPFRWCWRVGVQAIGRFSNSLTGGPRTR